VQNVGRAQKKRKGSQSVKQTESANPGARIRGTRLGSGVARLKKNIVNRDNTSGGFDKKRTSASGTQRWVEEPENGGGAAFPNQS